MVRKIFSLRSTTCSSRVLTLVLKASSAVRAGFAPTGAPLGFSTEVEVLVPSGEEVGGAWAIASSGASAISAIQRTGLKDITTRLSSAR